MHLPQSSSRLRLPCLFGVFVVSAVLFVSWVCLAVVASAMQVSPGCPGGGSSGVASYLFDCRVYELVSPVYKEGFSVGVRGVSEDGSRVLARSFGVFSDPEDVGGVGSYYELVRRGAGWEATIRSLDAPFSELPVYFVEGISPDFQSTLVLAGQYFVAEVYLRLSDAPPVRVGPLEPPAKPGEHLSPVGASQDLRRAVFVTHSPAHEEKSPLWPGDTTAGGRLPSLYEYEYTGAEAQEPRLVGVDNVGVPASVGAGHLISDCGTYLGSLPEGNGDVYNAVSASGAAVFFTAAASGSCSASGPPVNEVYARFEGTLSVPAHTVAISEPPLSVPGRVCTGECENAENVPEQRKEGLFAGASLDGSRVFFLTRQPLVNGDEEGKGTGQDLYEADISNGAVTRLAQVSRGGQGGPHPGSGAGVLGVARVSEDGSHVYFVAEGQLTGANREGKTPLSGAPNLYVVVRECPGGGIACANPVERTSFIATLSGGDGADWSSSDRRPVQATPDGRFVVFQSKADLTFDQGGRVEAGQVFEYDAEAEALVRVSRGQGGYNEDGNSSEYGATIPVQNYVRGSPIGAVRFSGLAVSEDGSRVFFSTADALTPQALNGVMNVYEYHDGQVGLISDGHDTVSTEGYPAVELLGTDESGFDVFFTTADSLVAQDTDTQVDVYDARIGGGFATPVLPAPCSGDSCQAPPSVSPSLLVPGVSSSAGETLTSGSTQNVPSRKKLGKRRHGAKKRRGKAHRGRKMAGRRR
jgi:hypothetical protein